MVDVLGSGVLVGSGVLDVLGSGVVDVVGSGVVDVVGSDVNNLLPVGYGVELATASGSKLLLLVNVYFDVRLLNFEWFTLYCPSSQGNGIGQAGAKVGVGVDEIGSVMGVEQGGGEVGGGFNRVLVRGGAGAEVR